MVERNELWGTWGKRAGIWKEEGTECERVGRGRNEGKNSQYCAMFATVKCGASKENSRTGSPLCSHPHSGTLLQVPFRRILFLFSEGRGGEGQYSACYVCRLAAPSSRTSTAGLKSKEKTKCSYTPVAKL